jgi:hypothetical protein
MIASQLYDWRTVINENKPGAGTEAQIARAEILRAVMTSLAPWAEQHDLLKDRIEVSAYTGAVSTKLPPNLPEAFLVARLVLWSFTMDYCVDRAHLAGEPDARDGGLRHLEIQLAAVVKSVLETGDIPAEDVAHLDFDLRIEDLAKIDRRSHLLGSAWRDIFKDLEEVATRTSNAEGLRFVRANATRQLLELIRSWQQERVDSIARERAPGRGVLPGMDDYMKQGALSTGFAYTALGPSSFESEPEATWKACSDAMESGARITRLCNDIGNYEAELDEGKINALIIALAQLGFDPFHRYHAASPELKQAKELLRSQLESEVQRFAGLITGLPDGRLGFWVRTTPAFVLAMYERGNYVEPA